MATNKQVFSKKFVSNNSCHPELACPSKPPGRSRVSGSILYIIKILGKETKKFELPLTDIIIREYGKDPYLILMSCLLSLRAKDTVTIHVCRDLFKYAQTPEQMLSISVAKLEEIIHKIGFYKNKAYVLHHVSNILLTNYNGRVPKTRQELLAITGIGPKTASLVLGQAYDIPSICVDVHVHRISKRLGIIKTKTPEATELALEKIVPKKYWIKFNTLLVLWGQNICAPVSPKCSMCVLSNVCKRVGVIKNR